MSELTLLLLLGILNIFLVLFFGPLFEGFVRKYIRAQIAHSRRGPLVGVWQPFLDLAKLLIKEDLDVGGGALQRLAPIICMAATLCAALLIPLVGKAPLEMGGDFIVFVYVMGISAIAMVIGGMVGASPYSYAGATREMMMFLIVEPVLVICLITAAVGSHSLRFGDMLSWYLSQGLSVSMVPMSVAAFALLMAMSAQFGKLPFDIAEADQEIMGGPFIEMSGPKLGLFKWAIWARQFIFAAILVGIFIPWPRTLIPFLDGIITIVKVFVVFIIIGLIDVVNPRIRIDQALAFYLGIVMVAAVSVVVALVVP